MDGERAELPLDGARDGQTGAALDVAKTAWF